jgi:hypothetical protein
VFVLAAMQERGELPPGISPFRFACMISGFLPQDPSWRAMCEERKILKVPTPPSPPPLRPAVA